MPRISALQQKIRAAATDELPAVDTENGGTKKIDVAMIMPTGSILDYAGANAPEGWLLCYGQTLDAQANPEYQSLYEAIGNLYGGSSNQDFVVPDLRGRVVAGADNMGGTHANRITSASIGAAAVLAATGGAETHTLTVAQMPSHWHKVTSRINNSTGANNGSAFSISRGALGGSAHYNLSTAGTTNADIEGDNNAVGALATGGGGAHNNMQPTIILNKIIKY